MKPNVLINTGDTITFPESSELETTNFSNHNNRRKSEESMFHKYDS